jgi:hypothetical protein
MSRAVVLPTTGDPYVSQLWANSCQRFWKDEVDKVYVRVNSGNDEAVRNYSADIYRDLGCEVSVIDHQTDHGPAITDLIHLTNETHILILEDDFYIKEKGAVSRWFEEVESGRCEVFGSRRGCTNQEIIEKMTSVFSLVGEEALQPTFWPCLLVASKETLLSTDENFAAKQFDEGISIPYIDYTPPFTMAGDTFVWASIQLRGLGNHCVQIDQNRLYDVILSKNYNCPWVHLGSSSAIDNGMLVNENNNSIILRNSDEIGPDPTPPDEGLRDYYACQIAWLRLMRKNLPIAEASEASYYNQLYSEFIETTIAKRGLIKDRLAYYHNELFQILRSLL